MNERRFTTKRNCEQQAVSFGAKIALDDIRKKQIAILFAYSYEERNTLNDRERVGYP